MVDPSELRTVAGVTPEIYARLRPWVCTLPKAERPSLNLNTLTPEQAPLLAMLLPDTIGADGARSALLRRPPLGFANIDDFWTLLSQGGVTPDPLAKDQTA